MVDSPYADLSDRLAEATPEPVVSLPDGSVDRYHAIYRHGERVETREAFGEQLSDGRAESYERRHRRTDPGGQSVNAARQAHALGADTALYGHLDHPVFETLALPTWSFGAPAEVDVHSFTDGALLLSSPSDALGTWSVEDLRAVEAKACRLADAGAVFVANWLSLPALGDALCALPDLLDGADVVFDPGDVTGAPDAELSEMADALGTLAARTAGRVVVSVNRGELDWVSEASDVDEAAGLERRLRAVQEYFGVEAAVLHAVERAALVTADDCVDVPNLALETVACDTGSGDRFGGALAFALAADWPFTPALALANAAAVHYVGTGETAVADGVAAVVERATVAGDVDTIE